jgi:hypothetical protein
MEKIGYDVLLESRQAIYQGGCKSRLHNDTYYWESQGLGAVFLNESRELLTELSLVCGYDLWNAPIDTNGKESVSQAVKDVADALISAYYESKATLPGEF